MTRKNNITGYCPGPHNRPDEKMSQETKNWTSGQKSVAKKTKSKKRRQRDKNID